jgi:nucleotide-binding universal stress UspA family protein
LTRIKPAPRAAREDAIAFPPTNQEPIMFKRILVPIDGSETSNRALVAALQMARDNGGRVRAVHAYDELAHLTGYEFTTEVLQQARTYARKVIADAMEIAQASGVTADSKLLEQPGRRLGEVVADEARAFDADLIVVGTVGRRGFSRALLGSGAEQVIRLAPVPVLVMREPETARA